MRLTDAQRVDWLRLARAEAVGPVTFRQLIAREGGAAQALAALPELARRGGRMRPLAIPTVQEAQAELEAGAALGARMIASCEPDYPRPLAALDAPAPLLWVLGDAAQLLRPCVGVVGARVASAAGCRFARGLAAGLGEAGFVVVSGMARGIDAASHEGALPFGTAAVLGGGVGDIYPSENAALYASLAQRGCIVSEVAPGRRARAEDFPRRNRIISGLSLGVVVVEAELKSGSLITARLAGEQGREVFAVPGSPLDPRAKGTNDLIRQGATLVEDAADVIAVLQSHPGFEAPEPPGWDGAGGTDDLDPLREAIAALLSPTPVPVDELARATAEPVATVLAALMELTLAGRAELLPGGLVISG